MKKTAPKLDLTTSSKKKNKAGDFEKTGCRHTNLNLWAQMNSFMSPQGIKN